MKIIERFRKTNSLRLRVLVPLIVALILILSSMALILRHSQQKVLELELAAKTREVEKLFLEYRNEEAKKLSLALSTLTLNKELMAAFKARDRERLHDLTRSYFERLRLQYHVTHLYFTGPDRVNILRVHQPERYGDRIDRFTTLEAEKTGKESQGSDLGPLGTFTLRVVTPWYDGARLLGYVELGMEVEHILEELREILDSRVYVFIDKELIQREGWEAGIRMLGHKEEWGHFPDTVIAGEPLDEIPENVAQVMARKQTLQSATDIHSNETYYRIAFIPLKDAGKREIGHIAILLNTTTRVVAFQRSVILIGIFYVLVGGALFVFFYAFLGQIEKKQKRLEEARLEFERGFRNIFDNANDGIILADIETNKIYLANKMIYSMLGYGPEEIKTLSVADIHPEKDLPRVIDHFERMQKGDFSIEENMSVKRKDGTVFYADISASPITLGGKNYLAGIFRDITERTKAEERIRESEARYRSIFEYADDVIYLLNPDGTFRSLNPAFEQITGWAAKEWIGKPFTSIVHPDDCPNANDIFRKTLAGESLPSFGLRLARKSGEYFDADLSIAPLGSDVVTGAIGIARDVTERKRAEEALWSANEFSRTVMDSIDDAISIVDVGDYRISGCNAAFLQQVGLAEADVLGKKCYEVTHNQPEPCGPPFDICPLKETLTTGSYSVAEHIHTQANGDKFYSEVSTSPVFDRKGKVVSVVHVSRDITERRETEEQIRELVFYDPLTHLANRRLLNDRLGQAMAASKRSGRYGAVMFLDLDNFKPLNDTHGHNIGDLLLIEVAHRITRCVRETDTVARFGGDEFVVMLNELDVDQELSMKHAGIVAEKIRVTLAEPYLLTSRGGDNTEIAVEHHCTSSIGVVLFINHEASPEDLLRWADMAMYQAKERGRNLVHFFEP